MTINITQNVTGLDRGDVRNDITSWASEHGIEIEVLNDLLATLGMEEHAEYLEIEVTLSAVLKVRTDGSMDPTDIFQNQTYEALQFEVNVWPGDVQGVVEVEVEDLHGITVESVTATDG